jgi:hypothetical protein
MSFLSSFFSPAPAPEQQPVQGQQNNSNVVQTPENIQQPKQAESSDLLSQLTSDKFNLWSAPNKDKDAGTDKAKSINQPDVFSNQTLVENITKLDFSSQLPADVLAKITAGGEEGSAALSQVLNRVGQLAASYALVNSREMAKHYAKSSEDSLTNKLPELTKQQRSQELIQQDAILSHPFAAPFTNAIVSQLQQHFPDRSPQEVTEAAKEALLAFVKDTASKTSPAPKSKESVKGVVNDWDLFFTQ